ncbi:MAG: hypothetical protein ACQ9CV_08465, partial [Nitrosopumilus sp.]
EATFGGWPLESVDVEVSSDGDSWTKVGIATNLEGQVAPLVETQIDLVAQNIGCISYVKLTDTTSPSTGDNFDVDAVGLTGGVECLPPNELCQDDVILWAGQNINAGTVQFSVEGDNLEVTYLTKDGVTLDETHLWVGDDLSDMPTSGGGAPINGQFPYTTDPHEANTSEFTYVIPLEDVDLNGDGIVFIVAHAALSGEFVDDDGTTVSVDGDTAYGGDNPVNVGEPGRWYYYSGFNLDCDDPRPPEEINEGDYRTQTQGGWGAPAHGNNPGVYRDACFDAAFPSDLTIGELGNSATLTTADAVEVFLPQGGKPGTLTGDVVDPSEPVSKKMNKSFTTAGVLAGQVTALTLSVGFDSYAAETLDDELDLCSTFVPNEDAPSTTLAELVVVDDTSACDGLTVQQVLDEANAVLSGAGTLSVDQIYECTSSINENFVDGGIDNGFLGLP